MRELFTLAVNTSYGRNHFIMIGVSIVVIVVGLLLIKKYDIKFETLLNIMLIVWLCSEATKIICNIHYLVEDEAGNITMVKAFGYHLENGIKILRAFLKRGELPFHLCSMQPILMLIVKFTKNENLKTKVLEFMFPTCLIGASCSILIMTIDGSFSNPQLYEYFFFHAALIIYAVRIITSKKITITWTSHLRVCLELIALLVLSIWINSILSDTGMITPDTDEVFYTNFCFSSRPPLDNLPYLNLSKGWYVYIIRYICLGAFLLTILDLPFILKKKNKQLVVNE